MKIYNLIRLAGRNHIPGSVKLLGLASMLGLGRRVAGVFLDPVMACNLRCRMCYFSDADRRKTLSGVMSDEEFDLVAKALFGAALKLQIGCGAEPTLLPAERLVRMIAKAKSYGVPYVSLTSNGQLIATGQIPLRNLVAAGLDELTLSMHGTTEAVYEELMPGAKYINLQMLIAQIGVVKREFPNFKLRVNFTMNSLNIADLQTERFAALWSEGYWPDVLQLRPVQNMGNTSWQDFDLTKLKENYDATIAPLVDAMKQRGGVCIAPDLADLEAVDNEQGGTSAMIEDVVYCYVEPGKCYKPDFSPLCHTFASYHRSKGTVARLIAATFAPRKSRERNQSKKLNYHVK